jgi:hypothetical protein
LSSRSKRGHQRFSYQVLESYRQDGTIRQRLVYNLGAHATPEEALAAYTARLGDLEAKIENPPERHSLTDRLREQANRLRRAEQVRRQIEELKAVVPALRGSEKL